MNAKLIKFLAGLCGILMLIIISEWLYANYSQKRLLAEIETVDKKAKPVTQLPTLELARRPESSYVNMVNRPLFIQGRRPVNEAPQTVAAKSTATATFNWSLNGIYTYKKSLYALLSRDGAKVAKDNYRKVTKNSEVDGWVIDQIRKDRIIVSQGDQQKELLLRKVKAKSASHTLNDGSQNNPPMPNAPIIPGQVPPGTVPPVPEQIPQTIPMPDQVPPTIPMPDQYPEGIPVPEEIPEQIPEIIPEPEPPYEPEMIPDQSGEIYPENTENVQIQ
jgi:hypothetical protein